MIARLLKNAATSNAKSTFWRGWYQFCGRRFPQPEWTFMNYGYAPEEGTARVELEPGDEPNRPSIELYRHITSGVELQDKDVLEVGAGRGGGSFFLARHEKPRSMTGVDLAQSSMDFANATHQAPNLKYQVGNAQELPFADASFDVVVNCESSHCYPDLAAFASEVRRVLRPGGSFCWCDMAPVEKVEAMPGVFVAAGLEPQRQTVITPRVLQSLTESAPAKKKLIASQVPPWMRPTFQMFAGMPGTKVYEALKKGKVQYLSGVFRKPA